MDDTKQFHFDTLLDEGDICNLSREKNLLWEGVRAGKKLVVYGPRNCGKTSLVKNSIMPRFKRQNRHAFVLFCDLMEVKSPEAIRQRIQSGFEKACAQTFPKRTLINETAKFFRRLRPQIQFDPISGQPSVSLATASGQKSVPFGEIFAALIGDIVPKIPVLVVFDEFQDIAFVPEAQGLFRQAVQEMKNVPVIFMGSKRHILSDIFAKPRAPLAAVGQDMEFSPIPYREYHDYIAERFSTRRITIPFAESSELQDALFRIPESVNIVCAHILDSRQDVTLTRQDIHAAMTQVVEARASRYEEYLSHFSEKEETVMIALSRLGVVAQPTGREFLHSVPVSARAVRQIFSRFLDKSVIEKNEGGYRLGDPLLCRYLLAFR